jgi:hypothetical protein
MGFLDINLSDAVEPNVVPGEEEYQIRLLSITEGTDKNGYPYILPRFDIPDHPTSKDFTKFLYLPRDGMDSKELNKIKWNLLNFLNAFNIDHSQQIDLNMVGGSTAWAILGVSENEQYGEQNYVKKFIAKR